MSKDQHDRVPFSENAQHERMIAVTAGEVTLTDRRTQRSWTIALAPYQLAAVPVTQLLYTEVTGRSPSAACGDELPVESVSWIDAVRFCNARSEREALTPAYTFAASDENIGCDMSADGYRLPTEAEWEYACRAGTTGPRYGQLDEIAWYSDNASGTLHEVASKQPNAWGFHDMLGNVWEWCWDLYDSEIYGSYRVLRGGGWSDEHWSCRASVRRGSHPTCQIDDVGFRVARSARRPLMM